MQLKESFLLVISNLTIKYVTIESKYLKRAGVDGDVILYIIRDPLLKQTQFISDEVIIGGNTGYIYSLEAKLYILVVVLVCLPILRHLLLP